MVRLVSRQRPWHSIARRWWLRPARWRARPAKLLSKLAGAPAPRRTPLIKRHRHRRIADSGAAPSRRTLITHPPRRYSEDDVFHYTSARISKLAEKQHKAATSDNIFHPLKVLNGYHRDKHGRQRFKRL